MYKKNNNDKIKKNKPIKIAPIGSIHTILIKIEKSNADSVIKITSEVQNELKYGMST